VLPDLSNSMYVARLRYIQSIHESPERRNPDTLVKHFLSFPQRLRAGWVGEGTLTQLRSDPFYYYLVARTKYYDQVVKDAVGDGVQQLINIGCGSDTRAYRFKDLLGGKGITILECDQAASINNKKKMTKDWRKTHPVEHLPIDLNDGAWPALQHIIENRNVKTLVLLEGVSPYIDEVSWGHFLDLLASKLVPGSHVAYDFKIAGVKDDFGKGGRTLKPFRLTRVNQEVAAFHEKHNLRLEHMELGPQLTTRLLPDLNGSSPRFEEDGLLRLRVGKL
jgi:methyltransferase (TIGR00027 family)